jgi:arylsulfatase A-like enzyme
VDDSVGRIMAYLKKKGLDKDTMIVFTSDNGFMVGEHGLIDKRNAYEPSIRVPLIVYAPGYVPNGQVNDARISNLDFAPTFLDLAGVAPPPQFEGKSTLPLWSGRMAAADWKRDDFVYEYYWEWNFPMTPTTFAIERHRVKYIQYHGVYDLEELYDVSKDPDEMNNLIDDPAYAQVRGQLRRTLYQRLANREGKHVVPFSQRQSAGYVKRDRDGPSAAPFPDNWLVDTAGSNKAK